MKIGYVVPRYHPFVGGIETYVKSLAVRAAAGGHEVEVLTQAPAGTGPKIESLDGVLVRRFRDAVPATHYAVAPGLWSFLRRSRRWYDVVHAHNYHALPALAAALVGGRPLIFSPEYHGSSESAFRRALHRPYRALGGLILRRSARVLCISEHEADLLARDFPWVRERVSVVSLGVDVEPLLAAEPFAVGEKVVLSAGRLERYKNVATTVEAMAHLERGFVLRVTGDGPAREALERRARELGLEERVSFLGRVDQDELHRWFRTASVFVTMSDLESSGLSPLEALAAGANVVASDIEAHREIAGAVGEGVTLVPSRRPEDLAGAIQAAARGRNGGPRRVRSWDDVAEETFSVYSSVAPAADAP